MPDPALLVRDLFGGGGGERATTKASPGAKTATHGGIRNCVPLSGSTTAAAGCHNRFMAVPPSAQAVQQAILQALYALFLGGIITAFLVVGLTTFYPQPSVESDQIEALDDREQEILACPEQPEGCELTAEQRSELDRIQAQREDLWDQRSDATEQWARTAGLVLIALATGLLALSLIRWDAAIVLSNGLLLGGLFTMVGGIGLTIASGEGIGRFLVLTLALGLTVALGYLRFARRGGQAQSTPDAEPPVGAELAGRVTALEARLEEVRRALGG
jgi:hypothetical protein